MSITLLGEFVLLAALWGASFLFMRLGAAEFGAIPTAGLRVGLAALFLLPTLLVRGVWTDLRRHARPILLVGLLNSAMPFALFAFAVVHIPTGLTAILNATVPMTGALVAWLWLGERPDASRTLGLVIGFAGVALLVMGKSGVDASGLSMDTPSTMPLIAMGAVMAATLCYGIGASCARKYLQGVHPLATATGSQIGATLGLALPMAWFWPSAPVSAGAWWAMVAVGLLCTALAYILFFHLIEQAGASKALTVTFMIPVFALFYGAAFLQETITAWMLGCGVIIVCGTALSMGLVRWQRNH